MPLNSKPRETETRLTWPIQYIVSNDTSIVRISSFSGRQNPTRLLGVARFPINSNARLVHIDASV